jgi:hypothetical protein
LAESLDRKLAIRKSMSLTPCALKEGARISPFYVLYGNNSNGGDGGDDT